MSHEIRVKVRWRDMDHYGHVNNAVYLTYLEECRDRMVEGLFGVGGARGTSSLRTWAIDYRNQLTQADGEITGALRRGQRSAPRACGRARRS